MTRMNMKVYKFCWRNVKAVAFLPGFKRIAHTMRP